MRIGIDIDPKSIFLEIASNSHPDEMIELVKELDKWMCSYDFTLELKDYFTEEIAKENESDLSGK